MNSSSSTLNQLVLSTESTTEERVRVYNAPRAHNSVSVSKSIENAIYSHIRAIRALGRKKINTNEIAESLSLPLAVVDRAVASLKKKGVRILGG